MGATTSSSGPATSFVCSKLGIDREPGVDRSGCFEDALNKLEAVHPRKGQVVELKFSGGLNLDECAEALHVSRDTVERDWRFAKLWLLRELSAEPRR